MAQLAGTTDVYDIKGVREDLQDAIYNIAKADTPFISNIGRGKAKSTLHEWQIDNLATADDTNAQIEGDEFAYTDRAATTRVGNRTQISRKTILISGTAEAVDKSGRKSEMKYQAMKAGKELKRDMEKILLKNQASVAGNATTARKLGGLPAWLTTNVSRGSGGANGGYNSGSGLVTVKTDGTARSWTESMLKDVHQSAYSAGGNPTIAMMPVAQKRVFSGFAGIAQQRKDVPDSNRATIVAAADVYVGDFGKLSAVPNRQYVTGDVFLLDPTMAKLRYLRPMQIKKPAQTGDAEKRVLLNEYTLEVSNEAAHATISDLQ